MSTEPNHKTDFDFTCRKCGIKSARVRYMQAIDKLWLACQCCSYEWFEQPLDSDERKTLATVTPLRPVADPESLTGSE